MRLHSIGVTGVHCMWVDSGELSVCWLWVNLTGYNHSSQSQCQQIQQRTEQPNRRHQTMLHNTQHTDSITCCQHDCYKKLSDTWIDHKLHMVAIYSETIGQNISPRAPSDYWQLLTDNNYVLQRRKQVADSTKNDETDSYVASLGNLPTFLCSNTWQLAWICQLDHLILIFAFITQAKITNNKSRQHLNLSEIYAL